MSKTIDELKNLVNVYKIATIHILKREHLQTKIDDINEDLSKVLNGIESEAKASIKGAKKLYANDDVLKARAEKQIEQLKVFMSKSYFKEFYQNATKDKE